MKQNLKILQNNVHLNKIFIIMQLGSRFDLSLFATSKGSKTNSGDTKPMVRFTPTMAKIRLNDLAMKELGVKIGDHVMFYDLGSADNELGIDARFLLVKYPTVNGQNDGFKIGTNRYVSIATIYNAVLLNKDGVMKVNLDSLKAEGLAVDYTVVKDGKATDRMATGATRVVSYELEQFTVTDEEGNLITEFTLDPNRDLPEVEIFKLVNRVEKSFVPGTDYDDENSGVAIDADEE